MKAYTKNYSNVAILKSKLLTGYYTHQQWDFVIIITSSMKTSVQCPRALKN